MQTDWGFDEIMGTTDKTAVIIEMAPLVGHCMIAFAHIDGCLHILINLVRQMHQSPITKCGRKISIRSYNQISQNLEMIENCLIEVDALAPFARDLDIAIKKVRTLKIARDFMAHGWLDVNALHAGSLSFLKKSVACFVETVRREQACGADIAGDDIEPTVSGIGRITLDQSTSFKANMLDRAFKQVVHEPLLSIAVTHHKAGYRPGVALVDEGDGSRVRQPPICRTRGHRTPTGRLAIHIGENAGSGLGGAFVAHVGDAFLGAEAGIAIGHAPASVCPALRPYYGREVIEPAGRRVDFDLHALPFDLRATESRYFCYLRP